MTTIVDSPTSINYWRNYLKNSNVDIFDLIDCAIMVAASEDPKKLRSMRDVITEKLFSLGSEELATPTQVDGENEKLVMQVASKESKMDINNDNNNDKDKNINNGDGVRIVKSISDEDAFAMIDAMEDNSQYFKEVLRIREILVNYKEESRPTLFDSLRRLQLMDMTMDLIQGTNIGRAVGPLRKHRCPEISKLACTLVKCWKVVIDEWVETTEAIKANASESYIPHAVNDEEGLPTSRNILKDDIPMIPQVGLLEHSKSLDYASKQVEYESLPERNQQTQIGSAVPSVNPSVAVEVQEDVGLPSPPLDDGGLYVDAPMDHSYDHFFDGMDDNGNLIDNKNDERRPCVKNEDIAKTKPKSSNEENMTKDTMKQQEKKNVVAAVAVPAVRSSNKPLTTADPFRAAARPPKPTMQRKGNTDRKAPQNIMNAATTAATPITKRPDQDKEDLKLEASTRKLQEWYQQAENAKRQRTIQIIELANLPKQGVGDRNRNRNVKHGKFKRQIRAHGRR